MLAGEIDQVPDYVGLLAEMCDDFDVFQQREGYTLNQKVRDPAQVILVYGLNAHAHYVVRRCLPILAESTIAAIPIVRSVFEFGVMAQWLRFVPGSEMTLMDEFDGHIGRVIDDLESSAEPRWRERATELRGGLTEIPDLSEAPRAYPARIRRICESFHGGTDLYRDYRVLSAHTHAGAQLAITWLVSDAAGSRVLDKPRESLSIEFVGRTALYAMGLSSRAFDDLVAESPRSEFLDSVEQRTGLSLWLSPLAPTRDYRLNRRVSACRAASRSRNNLFAAPIRDWNARSRATPTGSRRSAVRPCPCARRFRDRNRRFGELAQTSERLVDRPTHTT